MVFRDLAGHEIRLNICHLRPWIGATQHFLYDTDFQKITNVCNFSHKLVRVTKLRYIHITARCLKHELPYAQDCTEAWAMSRVTMLLTKQLNLYSRRCTFLYMSDQFIKRRKPTWVD